MAWAGVAMMSCRELELVKQVQTRSERESVLSVVTDE